MKYLVVLSDGMADWPLAELGNRTPMEAAHKPNMNKIASLGRSGLVKSLFPGMPTGSDVANMCILGYDPRKFYTGRSPIEAIGLQLELTPEDMVYRANLVSISAGDEPFEQKLMLAHDGANIEEDEAQILVSDLQNEIGRDVLSIHYGARYREILIWKNAEMDHDLVPPHDFTGGCIGEHLPQGKMADEIIALEKRSYDFLMKHPLNIERMAHGLRPANCIWLWGHGKKPAFYNFEEKRHVRGSIITAVPLLTGIAYGIGFDAPKVPGVTGDINTNYDGRRRPLSRNSKTEKNLYLSMSRHRMNVVITATRTARFVQSNLSTKRFSDRFGSILNPPAKIIEFLSPLTTRRRLRCGRMSPNRFRLRFIKRAKTAPNNPREF